MKLQKLLFGSVIATLFAASAAFAGSFTVTGTNSDMEPVAATANFTFGAGTLTLTLSNDISATDLRSAGQALSDFSFTLANGTTTGGTLTDLTGTTINIAAGGSVTPGTPVTSADWQLTASNTSTFLLTALFHAQPNFMIAPDGTSYPNVNASIPNFNPYIQGSGTFTITGDFTASTTISAAAFSFGTGPETIIPGVPGVPDSGATVALLGLAMVGLAAFRAKFRKA
jgi:VPDSG-CTERM exosortase interaction domain